MLDKKVIIVDCDLRKPKVHKNFDLVRGEGVSDVVLSKGNVSYKNVVRNMIFVEEGNQDETKIDVITAGSKVSNPSEIVNSQYFAKLIDELKSDYDLVLIDCPPISNMTDGVVVSKLTDGTIYVIESDKTDLTEVLKLMTEPIPWACDLPLNADGWIGDFFRKD